MTQQKHLNTKLHKLSQLKISKLAITRFAYNLANKLTMTVPVSSDFMEFKHKTPKKRNNKTNFFHSHFLQTQPFNRTWAFLVGDFITRFPHNKYRVKKKKVLQLPDSIENMQLKKKLSAMKKTYRIFRTSTTLRRLPYRPYLWMFSYKGYNKNKTYSLMSKYKRLKRSSKQSRPLKPVFHIKKKKKYHKRSVLNLWSHVSNIEINNTKKLLFNQATSSILSIILPSENNMVFNNNNNSNPPLSFEWSRCIEDNNIRDTLESNLLSYSFVSKYRRQSYHPIIARKLAWFINRHVSPSIFRVYIKKKKKTIFSILNRKYLQLLLSTLIRNKSSRSIKNTLSKITMRVQRKLGLKKDLKKRYSRCFQKKRPRVSLIARQTVLKKINRKYSFPLLFSSINSNFIGSSWAFTKIVNNFFDFSKKNLVSRNFIFQSNILLTRRNDPFQFILRKYTHFQNTLTEPNRRKKGERGYYKSRTSHSKLSLQNSLQLPSLENSSSSIHTNLHQWFNKTKTIKKWQMIKSMKKKTRKINITRIKFYPGYQVLWRRVRSNLKHILNLKYYYQKPLTRFVSRFSKLRGIPLLKNFEMSLTAILIKSRFVLSERAAAKVIKSRWVYINGMQCINPNRIIIPGDIIQFPVSNMYYVASRWMSAENSKLKARLYSQLSLMNLGKKHSKLKTRKTHYPDWILKSRMLTEDVPSFLEVDFLSLSIIMLFEPTTVFDFEKFKFKYLELFSPKLYNWKYIV